MSMLRTAGMAAAMLTISTFAMAQSNTTPSATTTPSTSSGSMGNSSDSMNSSKDSIGTKGSMDSSKATSGTSSSMQMSEQDVKKKLEGEGYSDISDVQKNKDGYMAKAMKDGKQVTLDVDGKGNVSTKK